MAELLTQLQDQLDVLSRKFYECVGILQRDAPPVTVSSEQLLATPPAPGFKLDEAVQRMASEIREQCQVTEQLIQLLPDGLGSKQPWPQQQQQQQQQQTAPPGTEKAAAAGKEGAAGAANDAAAGDTAAGDAAAGDAAAGDAFDEEMRRLQQEHQQVAGELAAAVEEAEVMLVQLQQMHALLAQAKLKARAQKQ